MKLSECVLLVIIPSFTLAEYKVIFNEGYSVNERPPTKDGEPLLIKSSINLRNILDVAEKEQIISLETTLRLYWKVGYLQCSDYIWNLLQYLKDAEFKTVLVFVQLIHC